jgi:hypothetical protein
MTLKRCLLLVAMALGVGALLTFALPACNTPFIPLPPPGDPTFTPVVINDGMGGTRTVWDVRGMPAAALSEAKVSVYNATVGAGVIVRAQLDGSYVAAPIDGHEGDRVQIDYTAKDGTNGPGICRLLQQGRAQSDCPL